MSDENRRSAEPPDAESSSATVVNQDGEWREQRRRHPNNNLRQQVDELRYKLQQQEEAIRNMGVVFSTLSGLRDHGFETNRDRRNFNQGYQPNNYLNNNRRGRPGNERAY